MFYSIGNDNGSQDFHQSARHHSPEWFVQSADTLGRGVSLKCVYVYVYVRGCVCACVRVCVLACVWNFSAPVLFSSVFALQGRLWSCQSRPQDISHLYCFAVI